MENNIFMHKLKYFCLLVIVLIGATFTYAQEEVHKQNRLADEKSPYLLQHADNPIDWYPWGEEAFEKAQAENLPIFLSIGYSTCHWCHVMEEESFEDEEVAAEMNQTFVAIKVDREERPDIDKIYMDIAVMLNGSGGWPLNIIMTPDEKKPFYAGTYIPKNERFGRIGMMELIPSIRQVWQNDPERAQQFADDVVARLEVRNTVQSDDVLNAYSLADAVDQLSSTYDEVNGGFGGAPKFPRPHDYLYLLREYKRNDNQQALDIVIHSLESMRKGGVYDQLGDGFYRYSTDETWLVPHFEKMLYDQAMLSMAFTEAYMASGKETMSTTTQEILNYVLRDMTSPEGGFYSAEDADSEGEEGKFYLWSAEELQEVLAEDDYSFVSSLMNVEEEGNWVDPLEGETVGTNIFHTQAPLAELSSEDAARWQTLKQELYTYRENRIKPLKDDKVLTDWNGLMIVAMAKAGRGLNNDTYKQAAVNATDFILNNMRTEEGRLLHRYRLGDAGIMSNLDDYAFFIWALLEVYETTYDSSYLAAAIELQDDLIERFWDTEGGAFYFTANDAEKLLSRSKDIHDAAIPSGNSVSMLNLLRLGRLLANSEYENYAEEIGNTFASEVKTYAGGYTLLMSALDFAIGPSFEVVIAGDPDSADTQAMFAALDADYSPNKVVILREPTEDDPIIALADYTKYYEPLNEQATAYVCLNYFCQDPTNDPEQMLELLNNFEGLEEED